MGNLQVNTVIHSGSKDYGICNLMIHIFGLYMATKFSESGKNVMFRTINTYQDLN